METLKYLFSVAGNYRGRIKFIITAMTLRGAFRVLPAFLLYLIILELLSANGQPDRILLFTGFLAAIFLGTNLWDHFLSIYATKTGYELCYHLRMQLGNKIRKLPLGFFTTRQTGELNSIMSEYISRVEIFLSGSAPYMFSSLACAVTMMGFFLAIDWRMALVALLPVLLSLGIFSYTDRIAARVTRAREESLRQTNSVMVEFIQGMPVIKIFNQVTDRWRRFQEAVQDFRDKNIRAVVATTLPNLILLSFTVFSLAIQLPVGLYFYFQGSLPLNSFIFFMVAAPTFSEAVAHYLFYYLHSKHSEGQAIKQIAAIMQEEPLAEPAEEPEIKSFSLEFEKVSFSYDKNLTLDNISFKIPEKSITALVGPSGAGKTTIASLIARFWEVGSGEVKIGGQNVRGIKLDTLFNHVSLVFQEATLFNDTVLENIRLGRREATKAEVIRASKAAKCHEFIKELTRGYETLIGEQGAKLSAGERQRLAIARAILKDASIIILDEATAFLDSENERLVQEAVTELTKDKTVLVIIHRLAAITGVDQILVLDQGRIVERGKHEELLAAAGLYRKLWNTNLSARDWKLQNVATAGAREK